MPRVGVTTGEDESAELARYLDRLREAGLEPVVLNQPGQTLAGCGGLVLTGGVDIDPSYFHEERHPRTQEPDAVRDEVEFALLREALSQDLPIFAICRGHQVLNVALGGSLLQHIEDWSHASIRNPGAPPGTEKVSARHHVTVSGSLAELFGTTRLEVNSRHHQAVTPDRLAPGLTVLAMSDDGYVEAMTDPARGWLMSVQWHPERLDGFIPGFVEQSRKLFAAFAAAVARRPQPASEAR